MCIRDRVEMYRSKDEHQRRIAADFRDWGLPTAYALYELKEAKFKGPVIASGGLQNGIDVAKSLALGADLCGMAGRILRSATVSPESVLEELDAIIRETRIAMFACGANSVIQMKNTPILKKK
jgi:isopentenyl-diphosphate delta-isomerase